MTPIPDLNGLRVAWDTVSDTGRETHIGVIHLPLVPVREDGRGLAFVPVTSLVRVEDE